MIQLCSIDMPQVLQPPCRQCMLQKWQPKKNPYLPQQLLASILSRSGEMLGERWGRLMWVAGWQGLQACHRLNCWHAETVAFCHFLPSIAIQRNSSSGLPAKSGSLQSTLRSNRISTSSCPTFQRRDGMENRPGKSPHDFPWFPMTQYGRKRRNAWVTDGLCWGLWWVHNRSRDGPGAYRRSLWEAWRR